jgi:hypothetical protein
MPRNRLPRIMKCYSPTGRRNRGRPLKRLLDTWDQNGSTSGPTPWQIDDVYDEECLILFSLATFRSIHACFCVFTSLLCPFLDWNIKFFCRKIFKVLIATFHHHHHHHVKEGLGLIPVPCILKMKLIPSSLPRSSYVSSSFWFIL